MTHLIKWDAVGEKQYETGVDHGVVYPQATNGSYPLGVAWNGLVSVTESPSGAEPQPQYADNIKYLNLLSAEDFGGTIEAFMFPPEFGPCDGLAALAEGVNIGQQSRTPFGMCYRTKIGNDAAGQDFGYKLHLVWGALVSPSEKAFTSVNESPEAITFSWEFTTTPTPVAGYKPTSIMVIDSTLVDSTKLAALETILYGVDGTPDVPATLPLPDAVLAIIA
jgi:hypothetical protein